MAKKSPGRAARRLAEREARRADNKERNEFSIQRGRSFQVFRAGRKSTT